jgi:hypothetical protein
MLGTAVAACILLTVVVLACRSNPLAGSRARRFDRYYRNALKARLPRV